MRRELHNGLDVYRVCLHRRDYSIEYVTFCQPEIERHFDAVLDALAPAAAPTTAAAPALTVDEQLAARLVALTNAERTKAGLAALATSPCATAQAAARAAVLVAQGRFQHDPLGPVFAACGGSSVGENLALGYPTPEAMTAGWMASPGHRENILRAYTTIGIGCVTGSTGVLCSQVFLG